VEIVWQRRAVADLYRVCDYIRLQNPTAAQKIGTIINAAIEGLRRYPEMGRNGEVAGTRELIVTGTPYLAVYRLHDGRLQILRILHGKQKWPNA
jgi:toxin ParE1/3/4